MCFFLLVAGTVFGQEPELTNVVTLNTQESEYSPAFFKEELVFVHQPINGRIDPVSKKSYFELYIAPGQADRRKKNKRFTVELNSTYHEGPVSFSRDGQQIFFTKTNTKRGVSVAAETGEAKLKIYYAYQGQYAWTGVRELPINDDNRNTLHPSLSPDGNRLFFASDRELDGFGGYDLYVSEWVNGKWSEPINLGPEVNTSEDEYFPFIHDSGQLFFASDRHGGMGKMDLYTINVGGRVWGKVYRLPEPYNSPYDDFGLILSPNARSGFLSSNRPGGLGSDDIYAFTAPNGIKNFTGSPQREEMVTVYDASTSGRLANARVFLSELPSLEPGGNEVLFEKNADGTFSLVQQGERADRAPTRQLQTAPDGGAELELREGKSYRILVDKPGYFPDVIRFSYGPSGPSRPLEIVLNPGDCMTIAGRITSEVSGAPINRAEVSFRPLNCPGEPTAGRTETDGFYYVCVSASCDYEVVATQHNFLDTKSSFLASTKLGSYQEFDLIMKPLPTAANLNLATLNTNSVIMLNNLRYNDDRFELNSSATGELNLLSSLMLTNPGLTIRLENHTETNGPREYLQDISQRRVNEIRDYLVNTGVGGERIQVVAHGSIVPRNDCPRPGDCDQEIHQNNRRTEVRILTRLP